MFKFFSKFSVAEECYSLNNAINRILTFLVLAYILCGHLYSKSQNLATEGAVNVTIPRFGPTGNILWTLRADEVIPSEESTYKVRGPNLKMRTNENTLTQAKSESGTFDMNRGKAWGEKALEVEGNGYFAAGKNWEWREETSEGFHEITFNSDAYVHFKSDLDPILSTDEKKPQKTKKKNSALEKTNATAEIIEFLSLEEGGYRFLLDGNVSVQGETLEIKCLRMEILVEQDTNKSVAKFGRISRVIATGRVRMKQPGRICFSDNLTLDTVSGFGVMEGNARVEDEEWGVIKGEQVELDRETGKARVIGNKQVPATLNLPNMENMRLPGLRKPKSKNK